MAAQNGDPFVLLRRMKFETGGFHPNSRTSPEYHRADKPVPGSFFGWRRLILTILSSKLCSAVPRRT